MTMTMTRNAIGNLINRYKAVLQKCNLMNTFGSLAVAAMLVMGAAGVAGATPINSDSDWTTWISNTPTDDANVRRVINASSGDANKRDVNINYDSVLIVNSGVTVTGVTNTTLTAAGVLGSGSFMKLLDGSTWGSVTTNLGVNSEIILNGTHIGDVVLNNDTASLYFGGGTIDGNLNVNSGLVDRDMNVSTHYGVVTGTTTLTDGNITSFTNVVVGAGATTAGTLYTNGLEIKGGTFTANDTKIETGKVVNVAGGTVTLGNITIAGTGELKTSINLAVGTIDGDADNAGVVTVTGGTLSATSIGATKEVAKVDATSGKIVSNGVLKTKELVVDHGNTVTAENDITVTDKITAFNGSVTSNNGDITLTGGVAAGSGNVTLSATNGAVSLAGIDMSAGAGKATVSAKGDVTTTANIIGGAGAVDIKSTDGDIDAASYDVTGGAGKVTLSATKGAIQTKNITANTGDVTLSAANEVITAAISSGTSGSVSATGKSVQTNSVTLNGGDVTLKATTDNVKVTGLVSNTSSNTGDFTAISDNGGVTLDNGINMSAGTGKATVSAMGDVTTSADITGGAGGVDITSSNGNINATGRDITGGTGAVNLSATNGEIIANSITTGGTGHITTKTLNVNALAMNAGGELNLSGEGAASSTITGAMELTGAKANVNELEVGTAEMHGMVAGSQFRKLKVDNATTIDKNSEIAIGDFNPVAAVYIGSSSDPTDNTFVSVQNFTDGNTDDTLNKAVTVHEGATLGYGDMPTLNNTLAKARTAHAPMNGGVYAAVKTLNLDGGSVNVGDPTKAPTKKGDANFSEGATLAVDQRALGNGPVFTKTGGTATVAFAANSNVVVTNAHAGDLVIADGGFATGSATDKVNVYTDTDMLVGSLIAKSNGAVVSVNDGKIVVPITVRSASELFPGLDSELCALIDGMYADRINDVDSSAGGVKFLSRATDNRFLGKNKSEAAKTIEGAARMISIAGVPQMAMAASNAATGAIVSRTSIGSLNSSILSMDARGNVSGGEKGANSGDEMTGLSAGNGYDKSGLAMWIMPLWQSTNNFGMKAGNFDMDMSGNLGGIALGVDYTFEQAIRAGISFNIGGGYAKGSGDFATSENRMNFWGLGAYVSGAWNNFGVTADLNYTSTFNDIRQDLNDDLRMGSSLKSEVYASALTAGLRGEYKFRTDVLDIMPHVGVRYMYLHTDEYDVKAGGDKIYKGDEINQHIWTFPIGVQLSREIALDNSWYVKPSLDLNITPAAGDVKSKNDIKFTGVNGSASMETQIMDHFTYGAQAGLEFGNDNLKLGLNYNLQAGAHTTNHGVFGTFRYEF